MPIQQVQRTITITGEMAFAATPSFVGVPDFGIIHIDPEQTAKAFQAYLDTASKLTGVSLDDLNLSVIKMPTDVTKVTLVELLEVGVKLFDAIVWLTAGRPTSHPLTLSPEKEKEKIPSLHQIARSVFYAYFMLVVQARYPVSENEKEKPQIPNFLRTVMGMAEPQHIYIDTICSFAPQKFDPAWVRHVAFTGFGQEVLSRFGLGVAGYRMFGPFNLYKVKDGLPDNLVKASQFAKNVAIAPASWNVHPLTRDPNILTARGNLNKNLGNLILDCFTDVQIKEMTDNKVLFKKPDREPAHRNYMSWAPEDDISKGAKIFNSAS